VAEVELSAGTIEYEDSGGEGPAVVLVHGLAMDGRQWRHVEADLRSDHRCVLPVLPMGAHRQPMRADADLSLRGMGRILAEFLEALDLRKYAGAAMKGRHDLLAATPALESFDRPVLVVWDLEGPMMPNEHGRRLAETFPVSRLVELPDCYTLIPLDQPAELAACMREWLRSTGASSDVST
jgi:pimeloyl-ACP methyl ester carboxylesterase